jgi:hypothetical protein
MIRALTIGIALIFPLTTHTVAQTRTVQEVFSATTAYSCEKLPCRCIAAVLWSPRTRMPKEPEEEM